MSTENAAFHDARKSAFPQIEFKSMLFSIARDATVLLAIQLPAGARVLL